MLLRTLFIAAAFFVAVAPVLAHAQSCGGRCDAFANTCWCDDACSSYGDCCADFEVTCRSPTIASFTPAQGPTSGAPLTLIGKSFGSVIGAVTIADAGCATSSWTNQRVVCAVPPGVGADHPVVLRKGGSTLTTTADSGFSYTAPVVSTVVTPGPLPTVGGSPITISGTNFGPAGTASVTVGGADAGVTLQSHVQLVVAAPPGEGGAQDVRVTVGGHSTTVTGAVTRRAPYVSSVAPSPLPASGVITIIGNDFGLNPVVVVGGSTCPTIQPTSHTNVRCTLTNGSGSALTVVAAGQASQPFPVTFAPATVTGVDPSTIPTAGAVTLTITGSGFTAGSSVTVAGAPCTSPALGAAGLTCIAPPGQGRNVPVVVQTGAQVSNGFPIDYGAPLISMLLPSTSATPGGGLITVIGQNFGTAPTVQVGGRACAITTPGHTSVICTLPPGEGITQLRLTAADQFAIAPFQYDAPQIMTALPAAGPTGGNVPITISGASFGLTPRVTVGGNACPSTGAGNTHGRILCLLPPGQGSQSLRVDVAGQIATTTYDYGVPMVSSVTPTAGPTAGGTLLTIIGTNFGAESFMTVGGVECAPKSIAPTRVTCESPPGVGPQTVALRSVGVTSNAPQSFTYNAPLISMLSPSSGPAAGGTVITIEGNDFGASGALVLVGPSSVTPTQQRHTRIIATMPAGTGTAQVRVSRAGETSNGVPFVYGGAAGGAGGGSAGGGAAGGATAGGGAAGGATAGGGAAGGATAGGGAAGGATAGGATAGGATAGGATAGGATAGGATAGGATAGGATAGGAAGGMSDGSGCGCGAGGVELWLALSALVLVRRRRR